MKKTKILFTLLAFTSLSSFAVEAPKKLTDPQIAAIVVSANNVDVEAGKLALTKTKDAGVKHLAQMMITDHSSVNKSAVDLVTKLKVTPEANDASKGLEKGGEENIEALKKLSGHDFDKAYVKHEVAYHQSVLDTVDKALIPDSSNAELKALLVKSRPVFVTHLQHAKDVESSMK